MKWDRGCEVAGTYIKLKLSSFKYYGVIHGWTWFLTPFDGHVLIVFYLSNPIMYRHFMLTERRVSQPFWTLYCYGSLENYRWNIENVLYILSETYSSSYTRTKFSSLLQKFTSNKAKNLTVWHEVKFLASVRRKIWNRTEKLDLG